MGLAESGMTQVDFGGVIRGNHCSAPIVTKPVVAGTVTQLALFLESAGGLANAAFGYLASQEQFCGIAAGGAQMSDHFTETNNVSDFSFLSNGVSMDPNSPEYVWLDVQIGVTTTIGENTSINYRFVFEYS
jgi:hypothetical protein